MTTEQRAAALDALVDLIAERVAERIAPAAPAPAAGPEPWIGVDAAAAHLGCSRQRVYDLVGRGRVPHGKDGRRLLFRRSALDAWLTDGAEPVASDARGA